MCIVFNVDNTRIISKKGMDKIVLRTNSNPSPIPGRLKAICPGAVPKLLKISVLAHC